MAAERYLSRSIPYSRIGNDIDKIDKKPVPSIYVPVQIQRLLDLYLTFMQQILEGVSQCNRIDLIVSRWWLGLDHLGNSGG